MTIDRRPLALLFAPYSGDYSKNDRGLDPRWLANPGAMIDESEALIKAVEDKSGVGLARMGRDPSGTIKDHGVHAMVWGSTSPKFRAYIMASRPRIDAMYLGWRVPATRNMLQPRTEPQLEYQAAMFDRVEIWRSQLAPYREFCGTRIAAGDESAGDAPGSFAMQDELSRYGMTLFKEMLPLQRGAVDPGSPVGYHYTPSLALMGDTPHVVSLRNLRQFDRHRAWKFPRTAVVHLQPDTLPVEGELESAVSRGMIVGVWPQWTGSRMQTVDEIAATVKLNPAAA